MLKFMYDHKGNLSIFTLIILIPVMVISGILIDFARLNAIKAQSAAVAETYANSYLSVYDELFNELYGLFSISDTKEGKAALEALEGYMQAAYSPNSNKVQGILGEQKEGSTWARGNEQVTKAIDNLLKKSENLPDDALSLMGSGLAGIDVTELRPLVSDGNYDALQMQISEYVKFIGPTELAFNVGGKVADMLKTQNAAENQEAKDVANALDDSGKNLEFIQEKQRVDNKIADINVAIKDLAESMGNYEKKVSELYNSIKGFVGDEVNSYSNAIKSTESAYNKFKAVLTNVKYIDPVSSTSGEEEEGRLTSLDDTDKKALSALFDRYTTPVGDYYDKVGRYYSYEDNMFLNAGSFRDTGAIKSYGNVALKVAELDAAIVDLKLKAESLNGIYNGIEQDIKKLIDHARELENEGSLEEGFTDQLENGEYKALLEPDSDNPLYYIKQYDFYQLSLNILAYTNNVIDKILTAALFVFTGDGATLGFDLMFIGDFKGLSTYDLYLESTYDDLKELKKYLCDSNKNLSDPEVVRLIKKLKLSNNAAVQNDTTNKFELITGTSFSQKSNKENAYLLSSSTKLDNFYKKFEDGSENKLNFGTEMKNMYKTLKSYNVTIEGTEKQKEKQKNINKLTSALESLYNTLTSPAIPRCSRILPENISSVGAMNKSASVDFKNVANGGDSIPSIQNWGLDFENKIMLMMYNYGMFTCQTSDKKFDESENKIKVEAPVSYQGITMAKDSGNGLEIDGCDVSDTNFMLYGELEYILCGNRKYSDNFYTVVGILALLRFVPNYLSTYKITAIDNIAVGIRSALSWCPIAAIAAEQLFRVVIAGLESYADLALLYQGRAVAFFKRSASDLSMMELIDSAAKDFTDAGFSLDELKNDSKTQGSDGNNFKITYSQYLLIATLLFVNQDTMIKRTADLIEVNMNYVINSNIGHDPEGLETINMSGEDAFLLSNANTAVAVTVYGKKDLMFVGDMGTSVFNTSGDEYAEVNDFARSMVSDTDRYNNTFKYTVVREY